MKKILLGTTALVAATAVTAGAAKADMSVSGWNTFGVGIGNVEVGGTGGADPASGNFDIYENGEIYFSGSTELDNGMTVGWDVQLETENGNGNFIDENYFTIAGDFGTVIIGQENLPNYKMHYSGGMWVGNVGLSSGIVSQFSGTAGISTWTHYGFMNDTGVIANDADMMSYYTPRMSGFQIGVGYMPDGAGNDGDGDGNTREDAFSLGVNYTTDMDGTSIAVSGGYTIHDQNVGAVTKNDGEVEQMQAGLRVGMGGLTLAVSYHEMTDDNFAVSGDTETVFAGIFYATGPHTLGLSGVWSEAEETAAVTADTEGTAYMLAHDYALGGGVSLTSSVVWIDIEDEAGGTSDADGMIATVMLSAGF